MNTNRIVSTYNDLQNRLNYIRQQFINKYGINAYIYHIIQNDFNKIKMLLHIDEMACYIAQDDNVYTYDDNFELQFTNDLINFLVYIQHYISLNSIFTKEECRSLIEKISIIQKSKIKFN